MKNYLSALSVAILSLVVCSGLFAQDIKEIKLKTRKAIYSPQGYYIIAVKDDRTDTTNIGTMKAGLSGKRTAINLENGAASAISHLIKNNTTQNEQKPAIELHITQLEISETMSGMKEQADLKLGIAFYDKGTKIIEYTGSAFVQAGFDASSYISQLIISNVERCLKEYEGHAGQMQNLKGVDVEVTFEEKTDDKDMIVYSKTTQLSFDDFKGEPDDLSIGTAATFSGFGMKYTHGKVGNSIQLKVYLSCYFDKSKSWFKQVGRTEKTLKHEQLHFDITAINACKLLNTIKNYQFSTENYTTELNTLLKEADKEGAKMQNLYDKETMHGVKENIQEKWEKDIAQQLQNITCF